MADEVRAHITGVVFQVVAGVGEQVAAGGPILILESMKMEIPVEAPRAGVVRELRVTEGQTVQEGEIVATLD
jgi:biotin carboxyl carrier protein